MSNKRAIGQPTMTPEEEAAWIDDMKRRQSDLTEHEPRVREWLRAYRERPIQSKAVRA